MKNEPSVASVVSGGQETHRGLILYGVVLLRGSRFISVS
jgi:hypothetical protein